MTELQPETDPEQEMYDEILIRQVQALLLTYEPEVIRIAAAVGRELPPIGVDKGGDSLKFKESLPEEIVRVLGRVGSR